jgi:hypothetical protein
MKNEGFQDGEHKMRPLNLALFGPPRRKERSLVPRCVRLIFVNEQWRDREFPLRVDFGSKPTDQETCHG